MLTNQTSEMLTNQKSEMSQTRVNSVSSESVKRIRVESPSKLRDTSLKKSKNQMNQILLIEDQKPSAVTMAMIEALTEQSKVQKNEITIMKAQIASLQKELKLVQKSVHTAPLASQPPLCKEKVISPVAQPTSMTVEEKQLKEREGYDYGLMKGNEGWTTAPEKETWSTVTRVKSSASKTVQHSKKAVIETAVPVKIPTKVQPTPDREAVQRGKQPPLLSQSDLLAKIKKNIESVDKPCSALLQKAPLEKVEEIVSLTLYFKLTSTAQIFPKQSMKKIIGEIAGIQPLNISVISPTAVQILFKKGDSAAFQKLLSLDSIQRVEPRTQNIQGRDLHRIAHLYLRGYFKELAQAALQDLPGPVVQLVLLKALEIVKIQCPRKTLQKKKLFNIQRDMATFQPAATAAAESS